jgi:hypothetical protein
MQVIDLLVETLTLPLLPSSASMFSANSPTRTPTRPRAASRKPVKTHGAPHTKATHVRTHKIALSSYMHVVGCATSCYMLLRLVYGGCMRCITVTAVGDLDRGLDEVALYLQGHDVNCVARGLKDSLWHSGLECSWVCVKNGWSTQGFGAGL